jgi:dihydropteroate synthase
VPDFPYKRCVRLLSLAAEADAREELVRVGADPQAFGVFLAKSETLAIALDDLPCSAAGILKQTALALGADCAVHRDVIRGRRRRSDIILFANRRQLARVLERLKEQTPAARAAGAEIAGLLERCDRAGFRIVFRAGGTSVRSYDLGSRSYVMGILNVTPDSFSDGGRYLRADDAVEHGLELAAEGADFLDVGAESTRPGALPVSAREELTRLRPVLRRLRRQLKIPISVDTHKSATARACLDEGADMVNDITGLRGDPLLAQVVAKAGIPCIIMHIKGKPQTMQRRPRYRNLMAEVCSFLSGGLDRAVRAGIKRCQVVVDPGIGFGKTVEHNFTIIRRLSELKSLGQPIMAGPSRKSFIGKTLDLPPEERLEGTIAACVLAAANGANILRVHDVEQVRRALIVAGRIFGDKGTRFRIVSPFAADEH